jgi:MFS family permease
MPHAIPGDQLPNHVDPDIATPGQLGLLHPVEVAAAGVEQRPDLELLETSVAPFLLDMAHDLGAELAAVGNLVGLLSAAWGVMSLMAGSASDRLGRRPPRPPTASAAGRSSSAGSWRWRSRGAAWP